MAPPKNKPNSPPPKDKDETNRWHQWAPTVGMVLSVLPWAFFLFSDYFGLLVDKRIDNKLGSITERSDTKVQSINGKLDDLGQRVAKIEGKLDALRIQRLAMQPKIGANGKQASEILNAARKSGTKLDPDLITDAGKQFISAGVRSSDPVVWNAALAFLDYRSFLNSALAPATGKFVPMDKEKPRWLVQLNHGRPLKPGDEWKIRTGSEVPAESATVLESIGSRLNAA